MEILKGQAFDENTVALAEETEAHSDDEFDQQDNQTREQVYHITVKEGRSDKVKVFFRMLDEQRQRANKRKRRHQRLAMTVYLFFPFTNQFFVFRVERRREDPDLPKDSPLTTLPRRVPIDWFDPDFWNNSLTVRERMEYLEQGGSIKIALPAEELCRTWKDCLAWKNLPEDEFMTNYGDAVLAEYNIPTAEEIERIQQYDNLQNQETVDDEDDDNEDDDDEDNDDEDEDNMLDIYD